MKENNIKYINTLSVVDYNNLRKSVGWNEIESNQAKTGIDNSSYIVSVIYNNKTIGMGRVVSDGGYIIVIVDIIVLPEFQGKGIGKNIMNRIMNYIKNSIKEGQGFFINLMSAKGKEEFYKKFGFTIRPNNEYGAGMTQWLEK